MRKNRNTEASAHAQPALLPEACRRLLRQYTAADPKAVGEAMQTYCALIQRWNPVASLVSSRDALRLESHVADSLSLLPAVQKYGGPSPRLFDIGSGAGFPALPLALACRELSFRLTERARKKSGFLELALGELGLLERGKVSAGAFPQEVRLESPAGWLITARAVEKPETVWKGIRELVREGAVFLCQWSELPGEAVGMFHVERIADEWNGQGLRRGVLHIVRAG
ncbi:MAG TPA: class I SAM-dependent methyltransferase [Candidatus Hydrogenedentes bacterium]|jgi:16S rRNA (guanine527-N7)-methyltransferase|nr:class I SAM-dependent methyltransferase [Candidatus Hydrogenedentota bacterium]